MHPMTTNRRTAVAGLLGFVLLLAGACRGDFDSYNLVEGLRLLAIASDKPDLFEGETASLRALVSDPSATYQWRWCPLTTSASDGYRCAVTDEEFDQLIDAALGADRFDAPPLDLGLGATATFTNPISPRQGRDLCRALVELLPDGAERPHCLGGVFPMTITLEVTSGDSAETIVGVRSLNILLDPDQAPNTNPLLSDVSFGLSGGVAVSIAPEGDTIVRRGARYELTTNAEEASSEHYLDTSRGAEPVPTREDLVISWFAEVGDFDVGRTSYHEGERPLEHLNRNEWRLPDLLDDDSSFTRIWFVIRDDRGGVSWLERSVSIGGDS
jgi:hypothetical protein